MASDSAENVRLYSIRRLCPFRGTLQVIELEHARALSADGLNWELQIATEQPDTLWGCINTDSSRLQYFRFGVWSPIEGLAQVPVNPIMDVKAMLEASALLLRVVEQTHTQIPFPLVDFFEYWLLDNAMQPLALIASSCDSNQIEHPDLPIWKATLLQEQAFCCHQHTDTSQFQTPASVLESHVQHLSGSARPAQWFRRKDNGDGVGLSGRIQGNLVARRLPASAFPELLLREDWEDDQQQQLAADFLSWSAPLLLTLQHISYNRRDQLEQMAANRPQIVEKLWRIYPEVVNEALMKATRVEARIRNSAG